MNEVGVKVNARRFRAMRRERGCIAKGGGRGECDWE